MTGQPLSLCTFQVAGTLFAVDAARVQEALSPRPIPCVPLLPAACCGLVLYRGEVITTVCVAAALDLRAPSPRSAIIVLAAEEPFGLLADRLHEVIAVDPCLLRPVPATVGERGKALFSATYPLAGGLATVLDVQALAPAQLIRLAWLATSGLPAPYRCGQGDADPGQRKDWQP